MNTTDNLYYDWPLITFISSGHEPQWVEDVLVRVAEMDHDHDMWVTLVEYMIIVAREEMVRN